MLNALCCLFEMVVWIERNTADFRISYNKHSCLKITFFIFSTLICLLTQWFFFSFPSCCHLILWSFISVFVLGRGLYCLSRDESGEVEVEVKWALGASQGVRAWGSSPTTLTRRNSSQARTQGLPIIPPNTTAPRVLHLHARPRASAIIKRGLLFKIHGRSLLSDFEFIQFIITQFISRILVWHFFFFVCLLNFRFLYYRCWPTLDKSGIRPNKICSLGRFLMPVS